MHRKPSTKVVCGSGSGTSSALEDATKALLSIRCRSVIFQQNIYINYNASSGRRRVNTPSLLTHSHAVPNLGRLHNSQSRTFKSATPRTKRTRTLIMNAHKTQWSCRAAEKLRLISVGRSVPRHSSKNFTLNKPHHVLLLLRGTGPGDRKVR